MKHAGGRTIPGHAVGILMAGLLVAVPQAAWADSDLLASAVLNATGGYSTNPFSVAGSDTGSAYVEANARPEVQWLSENNVILLNGNVDYRHYFHDYSDTVDYRAVVDYAGKPTSRLTTHADASYDSAIIGGIDAISSVTSVDQSGTPTGTPTTGTDVGLIGSRQRRRAIAFAGDLGYVLSPRDSFTANAYYDISHYGGRGNVSGLLDYDAYGGGGSYARRVSEKLQLGAQVSLARYVYNSQLGTTTVYTLQGTVSDKFSDLWSLTAAAGASRVNRTLGGTSTNATGNATICRNGERLTLCLAASDAILPTGATGTVNAKSVTARVSYVLSEHSTVSFSGGYTRNSSPAAPLAVDQALIANSYIATNATYQRTLTPRISLVASTRYRRITGGSQFHAQDIGGSIGISVHLGEYR